MSLRAVLDRSPALQAVLSAFTSAAPRFLPESEVAYLFGGITLGGFSPPWSDIDLILWVRRAPTVDDDLAGRALALWQEVAQLPLGDLTYLYVAPLTTLGGPMRSEGGGVAGQPASLRVYRGKARPMEGYPLSLPDTVSLQQAGHRLFGPEVRSGLPPTGSGWAVDYLRLRLEQLDRAVAGGVGPYGSDPEAAAASWGAGGIMSEPLWFARQLYSLKTGGLLSKEDATDWYLMQGGGGSLDAALRLIREWRSSGGAPAQEVVAVASLIQPALREFLTQAASGLGLAGPLTEGLSAAIQHLHEQIGRGASLV